MARKLRVHAGPTVWSRQSTAKMLTALARPSASRTLPLTQQIAHRCRPRTLSSPRIHLSTTGSRSTPRCHYVRLEAGRGVTQYLIVGGADHKTGEADDAWARFEGLESWIRGLLPKLGNVTHRWSGQTLDPVDYAAYSGRNPGNEHVFLHTGIPGRASPTASQEAF